MIKSNFIKKIIKFILAIIIIFYIVFLYIDIFNAKLYNLSNSIKFICIILCLTISLLSTNNPIDLKDVRLIQIALFLTVLADFFLLVIDNHYEIGIGIFSIAQITHSVRYTFKSKKTIRNYVFVIIALSLIYVFGNLSINIPILYPLAIFYGICLITNVILSIRIWRRDLYPNPNKVMITVGMIFFLLCDINVALYNILEKNNVMYGISSVAMWLFYLPSQVLLSLSGYDFNKGREWNG